MNILFICKHNQFRSRIAEALFNKYNKNKQFKAKSRGLIGGTEIENKKAVLTGKNYGININGIPKAMTRDILLNWQDIIVLVADDIPTKIFDQYVNIKLINWKIKDDTGSNVKKMSKKMKEIENKIHSFIKKLERNQIK